MRMNRRALVGAAVLAVGLAAAFGAKAYRYFGPYDAAERIAANAKPGEIQMYSYTTCGICRKAKRWFAFHGVPYQECYADRDKACNARFQALRTRGTPTFEIRGTVLQGFDPERIARALERPPATPVAAAAAR
jgi:glutaredoxin